MVARDRARVVQIQTGDTEDFLCGDGKVYILIVVGIARNLYMG